MRAMSLVLVLLALGALVPACGEEPANQAQIFDPTVGVDEDAACVDPNWYCSYAGCSSSTGAMGTCTSITTTSFRPQTVTCQGGGSWNVYDSWGTYQNQAGTYPCTLTRLDTYNWHESIPGGTGICMSAFTDSWRTSFKCGAMWCLMCHEIVYQNHFVNTTACPTAFVQCSCGRTDYEC